jgi:hypothetical protein
LDWIGLDWIGLDWIGLDWIGLDWIGLDWIVSRPYLMDILIAGLTHWFADTASIKEDYSASYHPLINHFACDAILRTPTYAAPPQLMENTPARSGFSV